MDQERFDEIAKKVFDGASRRRVLGGALASALGAGVAAVTGISAKGNKGKGKAKKGKGKGKAVKGRPHPNRGQVDSESTCTATDVDLCADQDGCCLDTGPGALACVSFQEQLALGNANQPGPCGGTVHNGDHIDSGDGAVCAICGDGTRCQLVPTGNPAFQDLVCVCDRFSCPNGCCLQGAGPGGGDVCVINGGGQTFFDGEIYCGGTGGGTCNFCGHISDGAICCQANGQCGTGGSNTSCGANGNLCDVCDTAAGEQCVANTCTAGTTTTTTTTTTAGPTTTTTACAGKLCPSGTCCPNNKKCRSGGGCKKKKK